jgi:nitroreductase
MFLELVTKRYSVRDYLPDPVPEGDLATILEAGRLAPTGANRQPQRLVVLRGGEEVERLAGAMKTRGAPLAIAVCVEVESAWKRPQDGKVIADIDATIVTDHLMIAATELGYGTLWVCHFDPALLRAVLGLPVGIDPVNVLLIGRASERATPPMKSRKALSETVRYGRWGGA